MDKVLRPERFCTDPSSVGASKSWIHWRRTFENFSRCSGSEFSPTSYRRRCSNMWKSVPTTNLRSQLSVIFTSNQQMKSTQDTSSLQDVNKRVKAWTSTYRLSKFSARNVTSNLSRLPSIARNTSGMPSSLEYIVTKSVRGSWKTKPWI